MALNICVVCGWFFFFQAEDGIRDLVRSRGLGDVYKRQDPNDVSAFAPFTDGTVLSYDTESDRAGRGVIVLLSLIHI